MFPFDKNSDKYSCVKISVKSWKDELELKEKESTTADMSLSATGADVGALTHYAAVTNTFCASE